jgi:RND family efflux transporter MFP subunit
MKNTLFLKVAICLIAATAIIGCGLLPKEEDEIAVSLPEPPRRSQVVTYPAELKDLYEAIEGTAQVVPVRETTHYFLVPGRLSVLNVEPQDEVRRGQLLAQLELGQLEYQLDVARLDAEIRRTQKRKMEVTGASVFDVKVQELSIAKQELVMRNIQQKIDASTIVAPYDGIVYRVQAELSDFVKEYDPVIELVDPSDLELQMRVSETDYDAITSGMGAELEVEQDVWAPAVVTQTTHKNPRSSLTLGREEFIVHFELEEQLDRELSMNERISARIILEQRIDTLTIPASCLRSFKERTYVRVLEGDARHEKDVKVGIRTDTEVEILEGLEEGDLVISR